MTATRPPGAVATGQAAAGAVPDTSEARLEQGGWVGRSAVLVADQGLNSATNILVTVLVARQAPLREFGIFATIQLGVFLGQTLAMAAVAEPWLQADPAKRPSRLAAGLATYRTVAVVLVVVCGGLVPVLGVNAALVCLAAVPALAGLDYVRVILFAEGRGWTALVMDAVYGGLQLLGITAWIVADGWHGGSGAWLAWTGAAYAVFGLFATVAGRRGPPGAHPSREPIRSAVNLRYGAEAIVVTGGAQLALLIVSARLGVAFNGILRATSIAFGPLIVLLQASRALLLPRFAALEERAGRRFLTAACAAYAVLCGGCTAMATAITQTPRLRVLIGVIHPSPGFVLLTAQLFLTTGLHLLVYFFFRARRWDRPVLISRGVLVGALVLSTAVSVVTASSVVFLISASAVWVVATVAMIAARTLQAEGAAAAQL